MAEEGDDERRPSDDGAGSDAGKGGEEAEATMSHADEEEPMPDDDADVDPKKEKAAVDDKASAALSMLRPNLKMERIKALNLAMLPPSYTTNTPEEEVILEYAENFRRQFIQLYPSRPELLLSPKNEGSINKFVCTTLKPTQLQYQELYEYDTCAKFCADHISYEPLPNPLKPPEYLPSSASVLDWQAGDCFDMSMVLCSFLIGVGYDAYCVSGYAPRSVALKDETKAAFSGIKYVKPTKEEAAVKQAEGSKGYAIPQRPKLDSDYVALLKRREEEEARRKWEEDNPTFVEEEEDTDWTDPLRGQRVHCWVLVKAGNREKEGHVYIEPSTGKVVPVESSPYLGVESLWNHKNLWVNVQDAAMANLSLDLDDTNKWEFIFYDPNPVTVSAEDDVIGGDDHEDDDEQKLIEEEEEDDGVEELTAEQEKNILELPPSWVTLLDVSRDKFRERCPNRSRMTMYDRVKHEMFSEYSMPDALVHRVTYFEDKLQSVVREVHETFANRRDKLSERINKLSDGIIIEHFHKGRKDGLKSTRLSPGKREFAFYSSSREALDGLESRVESLYTKVVETFVDRDDHLIYRAVSFLPNDASKKEPVEAAAGMRPAGAALEDLKRKKLQEPEIRKMTEKFARNAAVPPDSDVRKRTFYISEGYIRQDYHYAPDRITSSYRKYYKDKPENATIVSADPFAPELRKTVKLDEFQRLQLAEKECTQAVKAADNESRELQERRRKEEEEDPKKVDISAHDLALRKGKQDESKAEEEAKAEAQFKQDYLAQYMHPYKGSLDKGMALTKKECLEVKEACLKPMRERIYDRAVIIRSRLEEENSKLARRHAQHQRNRESNDKSSGEEEYERYVQEATFRIQILEQRAKRHDEISQQKFRAMLEKLHADPRLSALHEPMSRATDR